MSSTNPGSLPPTPTTPSAPKNKKSKKKKKATSKPAGNAHAPNSSPHEDLNGEEVGRSSNATEDQEEESEPDTNAASQDHGPHTEAVAPSGSSPAAAIASLTLDSKADDAAVNGDAEVRLDALLHDREALRAEVVNLRKSLEDIQARHNEHVAGLNDQVTIERAEKESAQEQYQSLLGRVNTIRAQLTERLKADADQLAEARVEIEQLQSQNAGFREERDNHAAEIRQMSNDRDEQSKELSILRNRTTLSQQNWDEERDDLIRREAFAREEFENAKQAMQDWEVLAMEERNIRQGLQGRVAELEDDAASRKESYEMIKQQRDTQTNTIEGLQKGLQEIQEARKQELREIVEKTQVEITDLRQQVDNARNGEVSSKSELEQMLRERDRLLPLEAEMKEKNLLIGKLRHEAVILNDHLTKALRQLKRGKTDDVIDRQLVTNHFLQFITLSHGDPKKFQILQLIAAMLNWTDEQREQAGLSRPGTSNPSLRNPISPWHRTPSTPTLNAANLGAHAGELATRKDSIAGLFSEFLESEAEGVSSKATSASESSRPTS